MDTKRKCVEERLDYMLETFSGSIVDILGRTKLYWISLKEKENLHFVNQSMSHFEYSHELKTSQGKYIQLQFGYANYVLIVWLMSWLVEVSAALKVSSAPNNFKWKTMAKQEAPSAQNELWDSGMPSIIMRTNFISTSCKNQVYCSLWENMTSRWYTWWNDVWHWC